MSETVQIPKGWELKKISDCGQIITGSTPKTTNPEFYGNDFPFFGPADLGSKIEISESQKGLTQAGLDEARVIPENSILVQCIGDIGKSSIIKKTGACNQQINVIIPNLDTVIPKFVYYWINSNFFREQMSQHATQTTLPILNKTKFSNLPFLVPSIPTQKQIVQKLDDILGQLEEKKKEILSIIEQNTQRIDFFEKNWRSYLITSEIENHPKRQEWKMVTLPDIVSPEKNAIKSGPFGSSLKKEFYVKTGYKIYGQEQVIRGDHEYGDYFIDENRFQLLKSCEAKPFDLLISLVGTIGKTLILPPNAKKGIINPRLIKITFNKQLADVEFFQLYLDSSNAKSHFKSESHGGTMNILNIGILKKLLIPLPPPQIQKQIVQNIKSAEEKFQSQKVQFENIKQNYENTINHINHIQSSILDAAFSGKLVK